MNTRSFALAVAALACGCSGAGGGSTVPATGEAAAQVDLLADPASNAPPQWAAVASLGRIAGGSPPAPSIESVLNFSSTDAAPKSGVYVSQFNSAALGEYGLPDTKNAPPFCFIKGVRYVNSIGVDAAHVVYVPQGGANVITAYRARCGPIVRTLMDPNGQPEDVAFDNRVGAVYVSDFFGAKSGMPGQISVYVRGGTTPARVLSHPSVYQSNGVGVDAKGNVFESFLARNGAPGIVEYAQGKEPGKLLPLRGLRYPDGLQFDRRGNLIVVDVTSAAAYIFAPPFAGMPRATIRLQGYSIAGKLDAQNATLYVSDQQNGTLDVYAYPSGRLEYRVTSGLKVASDVIGVAVDPAF